MFRFISQRLQKMTNTNSAQDALELTSAMNLLRLCYRSIDISVKSRHGRNFLKKRLIETWRGARNETDEKKQRMFMERGAMFLQALHMTRPTEDGKAFTHVEFQLSRVEAQRRKDADKAAASGFIAKPKPKPKPLF
jgi:hypothetical protein